MDRITHKLRVRVPDGTMRYLPAFGGEDARALAGLVARQGYVVDVLKLDAR